MSRKVRTQIEAQCSITPSGVRQVVQTDYGAAHLYPHFATRLVRGCRSSWCETVPQTVSLMSELCMNELIDGIFIDSAIGETSNTIRKSLTRSRRTAEYSVVATLLANTE